MLDTIREKVLFNRRALNLNNFATIELKAIESSADEKMKFIKRNIYINHYSDQPLELKGINYTLYLYLLKNRNGFKPKDLKEMDAEIINEMSLIHQNYFGELSKNKAKEEIRNIFTRTTSGDLRIGSIRTRINKYLEKISNENDDTLGFNCTDNEGEKCVILIVTRKKEDNRMQFYINYTDLKMVYNIYNTK